MKQRIIFKLLLFVYKILNNQAPKYLDTCLNLYTPTICRKIRARACKRARLHARVKLCSLDPLAYQKKNRPIPSGGVVFYGN